MKKNDEATMNEIVRESIKESGHYTAYTTCPKCGEMTMGLLTKVNDNTVLYRLQRDLLTGQERGRGRGRGGHIG